MPDLTAYLDAVRQRLAQATRTATIFDACYCSETTELRKLVPVISSDLARLLALVKAGERVVAVAREVYEFDPGFSATPEGTAIETRLASALTRYTAACQEALND